MIAPPTPPGVKRLRARLHPWLAILLACSLTLGLFTTAVAEATAPRIAEPALARLLGALTGIDGLLRSQQEVIREAAAEAAPGARIEVRGFPVRGAGLTRDEALIGSPAEWRRTLLDQSAALLYRDGTRPLADGATAARFETGGGAWALSLLGGRLHDWFVRARWLPALSTLVLITGVLTTHVPVRRWRILGLALAGGAAGPVLFALAGIVAARAFGGPPGTLSGEAATVVAILARGPLIQGGTVVLGGLALWWWARRPVEEDDPQARLAVSRAERDARRRAAAGLPPAPRHPRD